MKGELTDQYFELCIIAVFAAVVGSAFVTVFFEALGKEKAKHCGRVGFDGGAIYRGGKFGQIPFAGDGYFNVPGVFFLAQRKVSVSVRKITKNVRFCTFLVRYLFTL